MNCENKKIMKDCEIETMGKVLGSPSKEMLTNKYKRRMVGAVGSRNEFGAIFGTIKLFIE